MQYLTYGQQLFVWAKSPFTILINHFVHLPQLIFNATQLLDIKKIYNFYNIQYTTRLLKFPKVKQMLKLIFLHFPHPTDSIKKRIIWMLEKIVHFLRMFSNCIFMVVIIGGSECELIFIPILTVLNFLRNFLKNKEKTD